MNKADTVHETMMHCLFEPDEATTYEELPDDAIVVDGVMGPFALHPDRLKEKDQVIRGLVEEIPVDDYMRDDNGGGGQSFLNLCQDREGKQWTGMHRTMNAFFVLAAATGRAGFCAPRDTWPMLPGGMPYIWFSVDPQEDSMPQPKAVRDAIDNTRADMEQS